VFGLGLAIARKSLLKLFLIWQYNLKTVFVIAFPAKNDFADDCMHCNLQHLHLNNSFTFLKVHSRDCIFATALSFAESPWSVQ